MYNLDAYITDFLLENKKLSAQGLGEFSIVDGQAENGAPKVQFVHDKGAYTSEELVHYIAQQQGKNKIVTGFDVESHLNQVKQFINIGTPWTIPGLGQLHLGKSREFEFIQQTPLNEHTLHERNRRKQASADAPYQAYDVSNPATAKSSNTGTILLTLFIILALGAGGYYFYTHRSSAALAPATKDTSAMAADTMTSVAPSGAVKDTAVTMLQQPPASSNAASPNGSVVANTTAASSPAGFRFVLSRTSNAAYALKRFGQLKLYGAKVDRKSVV